MNEKSALILEALPQDGLPIGNNALKKKLNLREVQYNEAKKELLEQGLARTGRGRGGGLRKVLNKISVMPESVENPCGPTIPIKMLRTGERFVIRELGISGTFFAANEWIARVKLDSYVKVLGEASENIPGHVADWDCETPVRRLREKKLEPQDFC